MNKKLEYVLGIIGIIAVIAFLIVPALVAFTTKGVLKNEEIPSGYIAVFHGGVGEQTYETYIYKIDNGQANMGFNYINTISTTESWGSPNWNVKIVKKGSFDWTDGAFIVAKDHGAYSYVTLPNSTNTYSITEFQGMFIMN